MDNRPITIFCDIDGTLVEHFSPQIVSHPSHNMSVLPGTIEKFNEWDRKGYRIILTTGRKESMRNQTVSQLSKAGIFYDHLIMGIGGGKRILINDKKPYSDEDYAISINLKRNGGIGDINL